MTNEYFMQRCIDLANNGMGRVAPNPMVGAVLLHDGKIIGEGFHQQYGHPHAEVNAIHNCENKYENIPDGTTLFVNLEPCNHHGKTPPCTELIINKGIKKVVIGAKDTNDIVQGKGMDKLLKAGIEVVCGILEKECKEFNKTFYTFHEKHRPYVILKWAQSLDGYISAKVGITNPNQQITNPNQQITNPNQQITNPNQQITNPDHQNNIKNREWISNEYSRKLTHKWRSESQAIMVGTNTAMNDDPTLNVRLGITNPNHQNGKNLVRITLDKDLRLPKHLKLFDQSIPSIIFTQKNSSTFKNLEFINIDFSKDVIKEILKELHKRNIQSLIVEGGATLLNSFIDGHLWDEAKIFISENNLNNGIKAPDLNGTLISNEKIGNDLLMEYRNFHF